MVAEAPAAGVAVCEVSWWLGIADSLIYNWQSEQRSAASIANEPLQLISYGVMAVAAPAEPVMTMTLVPTTSAPSLAKLSPPAAPLEDLVGPRPGVRPGSIDIGLPTGVRLWADSYVNEKALARVLRALGLAS